MAFHLAPEAARTRLVEAVDHITLAIESRYPLDIDAEGSKACAHIIWSVESVNSRVLLQAAGRLLPILLHSGRKPVSSMVAATFPLVYKELANREDVPDMLKFIPFFDWDRCRAARRELVNAFLSSPVWAPSDLALTAYLCSDTGRILTLTAKSVGGEAYIDRLEGALGRLSDPCREQANRTITEIRSRGGL